MLGVIRKPKDFLAGLMFFALGAGALLQAQSYALGTARHMGPGYFPTLLSGLLCALALILIVRSLFGAREAAERMSLRPLLIVTGGVVAFAALLKPAGLIIAIMSMVLIATLGSSQSRPLPALLLALGLAAGSVLVFVTGLGQSFPILGSWFEG